jgi:hypothetical protein
MSRGLERGRRGGGEEGSEGWWRFVNHASRKNLAGEPGTRRPFFGFPPLVGSGAIKLSLKVTNWPEPPMEGALVPSPIPSYLKTRSFTPTFAVSLSNHDTECHAQSHELHSINMWSCSTSL